MKRKHKVLIALDGSTQSFNALEYIGWLLSSELCALTLLHILPDAPEAFNDLDVSVTLRSKIVNVGLWNVQIKDAAEKMMAKASKMLRKAGFPDDTVDIQIRKRKVGIARDIVAESQEGYAAVVVGRTGLSKIKDILMGSIANKLVHRIHQIPVVVVDGKPSPEHVLIGFDGSESAWKAVDCVCALMPNPSREVKLCHVIRSVNLQKDLQDIYDRTQEESWIKRHHKQIRSAFTEADKKLKKSGIAFDRIQHEIVENKISRAVAITKSAREGGFGTIVVGRRGLTVVEAFLMGRVSQKVLAMSKKTAVWVV